jgi:transposase
MFFSVNPEMIFVFVIAQNVLVVIAQNVLFVIAQNVLNKDCFKILPTCCLFISLLKTTYK